VRVVLVGPPGAGKGTQAQFIASHLAIPTVSTGEIFRRNVSAATDLGREEKAYMDRGDLVPDEITVAMVADRLAEYDAQSGFLLDGFPRNVPQAEALDTMLAKHHLKLDHVILLEVDEPALVDRLSGRFSCVRCGASYHDRYNRPRRDEACDVCGSTEFVRRADDRSEAVKARFDVYRGQTAPILPYYRDRGILRCINGMADIDAVTEELDKVLASGSA